MIPSCGMTMWRFHFDTLLNKLYFVTIIGSSLTQTSSISQKTTWNSLVLISARQDINPLKIYLKALENFLPQQTSLELYLSLVLSTKFRMCSVRHLCLSRSENGSNIKADFTGMKRYNSFSAVQNWNLKQYPRWCSNIRDKSTQI